ncbi:MULTISPECIES: PAS domain S-box protein [Haloarcula]|uniref:PAS domain S-box protein n=1 Tax=Haloarcula TaxID=2237 RepID=UPI0023ED4104|nr:PAS domain S-box protein [Halomicroarcula sp. XH51]
MTSSPSRRATDNGTIAILHVDDEPGLLDLTKTYLEVENDRFEVTTASDVDEGLAMLAEHRFDCIVSDYDIPDRNGIEFLSAVREDHPDLPFILYTGKGSEEIASEAISRGVTDYLQKETGTGQYTVLANRITNAVEQYRAATALEESRDRLSLLLEQSPLGVLEYDEDFEIVRLNETGEEILGYTESELVGETWEVLVTEESYEHVDRVTDELEAARGGFRSVDENVRKDGERIVCEWHNRVITDDDGDVVTVISLFQDVTDRRERQRDLERYKAYLEGSTDIITVLDEDRTIQYQSPSVTRILGYDAGQLVGEQGFEYVHPDDRASALQTFEQLLTSDERRTDDELRFRTAGDEWRWLELRATDYRDHPGIDGIVVNSRDVTGRKKREQALQETKARLESLFDESPDMINIHDIDGNIIDPNPRLCEQTGYDESTLTAMKVWDVDERADPETARAHWQSMDQDDEFTIEGRYRRKDGSTFPVEVHTRRHDMDDEARFIVVSRDISERKAREEQLEQFASVVSHDLRNPLHVAGAHLELAREDCESDHLDRIEDAHERMSTLIDDLLQLARDGNQMNDAEPVDLATLVTECWQTVETEAATLRADVDCSVHADRSRLKQLFENLLRNAVEHGGESVTVTVGELADGFYVEDDGPGLPAAYGDAVFEPGWSNLAEGTGFGLSIARRVADAHGWSLDHASGETGGARFEITGVEVTR